MVGGASRPYKMTIRPALQVLGTAQGVRSVSGVYALLMEHRKVFFGDCTVNVTPDAERLAEIALNTARVASPFGVTPRIAMLSYSDFGAHSSHARVQRVQEAVDRVRSERPDIEVDGEMQAYTALDPSKLADFPFTHLSGPANVLVFPDLTSGNIGYQLVDMLADAEALGPLLVGVGKPMGVIPTHATASSIVDIATYVVNQDP